MLTRCLCQERLERLSQRRAGPSPGYRARRLSRERLLADRRDFTDSNDSLYGSSAGDISQHQPQQQKQHQQSLKVWLQQQQQEHSSECE